VSPAAARRGRLQMRRGARSSDGRCMVRGGEVMVWRGDALKGDGTRVQRTGPLPSGEV
jgi:hypothetical protein